jgi:hypothetical protein
MMRPSRVTCGLALLAAGAASAAAQHPLVTLPLTDPAYVQLDALVRQGCVAARLSPYRPYLVLAVRQALVAAHKQEPCAGEILELLTARFARDTGMVHDTAGSRLRFGAEVSLIGTGLSGGVIEPLWRDVRPVDSGPQPVIIIPRARLTFNGGPNFVAMTEVFAQSGVRDDPTIREENFRHGQGVIGVNEAYFNGRAGPVYLFFGREPVAWIGEGDQSLALSAAGPPLDHFGFTLRLPQWEFQSFVGQLSDVDLTPSVDGVTADQHWLRNLYAHALTFWPWAPVELSVGETALVPRTTGGLDWAYLNPIMPYQLTQHEKNQAGEGDANLTGFLSVRATAGKATLSGQLLIDDFQLDANDKKIYPNQLAWTLGATYPLRLALATSIGVHWQKVQSFTYVGQPTYTKVYQSFEAPLGSSLGPDAQTVLGTFEIMTSPRLRFAATAGWWERGSQRLNERPPIDRTGHANDPFPDTTALRPKVQTSVVGGLQAQWLDETWPISLDIGDARISDVNNQPTAATNYFQVRLSASWRWRYP